jgi:hypothetical protein
VVVGASCLESTRRLLNSKLANSSGVLGRYLHDQFYISNGVLAVVPETRDGKAPRGPYSVRPAPSPARVPETRDGKAPRGLLGKGFLTGKIDENTTFDSTDFRNLVPRFTPENRKANQVVVDLISDIARGKNATPAQIALAWVLAQKPSRKVEMVPIPGTTNLHRLTENLGAATIELTADDLREIESTVSELTVQGDRYPAAMQQMINR